MIIQVPAFTANFNQDKPNYHEQGENNQPVIQESLSEKFRQVVAHLGLRFSSDFPKILNDHETKPYQILGQNLLQWLRNGPFLKKN